MPRVRVQPVVLAGDGDLSVERDPLRSSGRLLRTAEMDASYVDLADPSHLEFDYLRWIRIVLSVAHARRVVHVGGGACSLARALAAKDPNGLQLVCEIDGQVLAIAREHMGLRRTRGLRVRQIDGREFVARQATASFDAIVIDAFIGAVTPPALLTVGAFDDAARVAPLTLINVVDDRSGRLTESICAALGAVNDQVWSIHGRAGNTVLIGGSLARSTLQRIGAQLAGDHSPAQIAELHGNDLNRKRR
jgi:hypothetical protein